ncbi:MAG: hypothetical protein EB072_15105 [Betaproteobacteria bacterium]|nr:hypothetical protein [Betaproteobacteria bacterium]
MMQTIPNTTGLVGIQVNSTGKEIKYIPIVAWRVLPSEPPEPVYLQHHGEVDGIYDQATGQVTSEDGDYWPTLKLATGAILEQRKTVDVLEKKLATTRAVT